MKTATEIIEKMKSTYDMLMEESCKVCNKFLPGITEIDEVCVSCKMAVTHCTMTFGFYKDLDIPIDKGLPHSLVMFDYGHCLSLENYDELKDKMIDTLEKIMSDPARLIPQDKIECRKCGQMISPSSWIIPDIMHAGCKGTGEDGATQG